MTKPDYPTEIVSLYNVCLAFLDRRNVKLETIYNTDETGFNEEYYWKDNQEGNLPKKDDIQDAYIKALEMGLTIPHEVKELYQKVMSKKGIKKGAPKIGLTETAFRRMFAITIRAIAEFEEKTNADFFPIKNKEDAKKTFFEVLKGEYIESKDGGNGIYRLALNERKNRKGITMICDILENLYKSGQFPKEKPITMPADYKKVAQWGSDLINKNVWLCNPWRDESKIRRIKC